MKPLLPQSGQLEAYLKRIDENRVYSNHGPLHDQLLDRFSEYFSVEPENLALVTNGTIGLTAAIASATPTGGLWGIPSWTFAATAHAVVAAGCDFHLLDCDEGSWSISPPVDGRFSGVIEVWPFGDCRSSAESLSGDYSNLRVIDAASCFDSCKGIGVGMGRNTVIMISLHATKLVSTAEGGLLIGPKSWITEIRRWANFGFWGSRESQTLGTNAKISEYQAAIGLASLDQWPNSRRSFSSVLTKLNHVVNECGFSAQPAAEKGFISSTFVVNFNSPTTKDYAKVIFNEFGIETRDWWGAGIHSMQAFASRPKDDLSVTDKLAQTTLGIPFYVDITDGEIERIQSAMTALVHD